MDIALNNNETISKNLVERGIGVNDNIIESVKNLTGLLNVFNEYMKSLEHARTVTAKTVVADTKMVKAVENVSMATKNYGFAAEVNTDIFEEISKNVELEESEKTI